MKKIEAQELAIERSKVIIEYITQILSDSEKVNASMEFTFDKIDNQNMLILNISVPKRDFKRSLNLGITTDHQLVLIEQLLNDLLDTFLAHETIGISRYYSLKSMGENFSGIDATNVLGSRITINLNASGPDFMNLISEYKRRLEEFVTSMNNQEQDVPKRL